MMVNGRGARPSDLAADKVGPAVAVAVEQCGHARHSQVAETRDSVGLCGRGVDEVALEGTVVDRGSHCLHRLRRLDEGVVKREPAAGPEVDLARSHRLVELRVVHRDRAVHPVAELLQQKLVDLRLEPARVPSGPGQPDPGGVAGRVLRGRFSQQHDRHGQHDQHEQHDGD